MKIFHCVESYSPSVGGMQEVVKQLSERLVQLGHEVFVLTRANDQRAFTELNGVKVIGFNIIGNPKKASNSDEQAYIDFLLNETTDIVTFFAAQQWATDLALPILKQIKAKKVSVPTGYSGLYWPEFRAYFEDMKTFIHDYDMNVYLSNDYRDINFARAENISKITLIPNGAAADEFLKEESISIKKTLNIPEDHFVMLLVGSYTGWKGHLEAIQIFLNAKINNATLLMIGNNYYYFKRQYIKHPLLLLKLLWQKIRRRKTVIFNYFDRPFTVAAYKQSDLFLFPSNIECSPIVLFECAAAKLPFLSTDVGNTIEIAEWTKGGEIMKTHKDKDGFSHADILEATKHLERLYKDHTKRKDMSEKAFSIWQQKYSWEVISQSYEKLYLELLSK
jgi:L-malate glycosyltransferase